MSQVRPVNGRKNTTENNDNLTQLAPRSFDECKNIETGAVFIIASGASAKYFPIENFAHIPMITMNGAISMFLGTHIKPFFTSAQM